MTEERFGHGTIANMTRIGEENTDEHVRFRGPLNRTDVRTYYCQICDEIIDKLIEQIASR